MKSIIVFIFCVLLAGTLKAQVNLTNGQIAGSGYTASEVRNNLRTKTVDQNGLQTKGSPYVNDEFMSGELNTYRTDGVKVKVTDKFRLNASNNEMEIQGGRMVTPLNHDTLMMDGLMYVYINRQWMVKLDDLHYLKHHTIYAPGHKAENTKVAAVANKWRKMKHYYELDNNGKLVEISRRRAKKLKLK